MRLPEVIELEQHQEVDEVFGGYNHNLRINTGEYYDMRNLTSSYYPLVSPRGRRGTYKQPSKPLGMIAKDKFCYVDGRYIYIGDQRIDMALDTSGKKTLVSMGAYIVILPDKKYINTADLTDKGDIETEITTSDTVELELARLDGEAITVKFTQDTEPTEDERENGDYWIDTSADPHTLKRFSSTSGMWITVLTTYIKIKGTNIGKDFKQYDGVNISGFKDNTQREDLAKIDGSFVVWARDDDYIVIIGMLDYVAEFSRPVTVSRKMPEMDFVCESNNRIWGCRYGENSKGEFVNEIYASKLGDFRNWSCFMGTSQDSYTASCGTDGEWTGAISYLGYPLFFKENVIHKVYGQYPANYQIQTTACRGVQKGSSDSLNIVNEILYYKGKHDVLAYDGSLPAEISLAFGDEQYTEAKGCGYNGKYYLNMKDKNEVYHLFVYDTNRQIWCKEDEIQVDSFCVYDDELYYIDSKSKDIRTINGTGTKDGKPVKWMAETGIIGMIIPNKKTISRMLVRMSLAEGSKVRFFIQYDSCGEWEYACTMSYTTLRTFSVPIKPHRCDHFRLRIEGEGDAKIYSMTRVFTQGSDM